MLSQGFGKYPAPSGGVLGFDLKGHLIVANNSTLFTREINIMKNITFNQIAPI